MSDANAGSFKHADPWEALRKMQDAYMDLWSKSMIEAVNTEEYAKVSGAMGKYLAFSNQYRETLEKAVTQALQQLGLPTSEDFAGLAGRLTNLEMRLDDMDATLNRIEKLISRSESGEDLRTRLDRIEKLILQQEHDRQQATRSAKPLTAAEPTETRIPRHSTVKQPGEKVR